MFQKDIKQQKFCSMGKKKIMRSPLFITPFMDLLSLDDCIEFVQYLIIVKREYF